MDLLERNLLEHLHYICLVPSRHVGSPGVAAAADYIEKSFRDLGYETVSQEKFPTIGWRFGSMLFVDMDNACCDVPGALPCFFSQSTEVCGVPVWLDDKSLKSLTSEQVRGKLCIVEFFSEATDIRGRNGIAEDLDKLGAAGAVFISDSTFHTTCSASTKIQRSPELKNLGAAVVSEDGAYYLSRNRNHRYKLFIDADNFDCQSGNVVAVRHGTGKYRAIFGAHHDASPLTQGAADNGSGVACVLEMARLLKNELPEWTFEFASFDAEEYAVNGFPVGSKAFADRRGECKWEFFMNFDHIGVAWAEDVLHVGRTELLPAFQSKYPFYPFKSGGDDRTFDDLRVPTLWYNSHCRFRDFHTPKDTIATLNISNIAAAVTDAVSVVQQICTAKQ